jgi:hypothetical protein
MLRLLIGISVVAAALLVAPRATPQDDSCMYTESSFTTDSLHDLRSFADAMAVVRATGHSIPPPPGGPEGWAGLIGRKVTVRVERVLWRRPGAPEPPRTFRFDDWGWTGTLENRRRIRPCGETRMVVGRRYLAPIGRGQDGWFPFPTARLRLRRDLVVGGVDGGEAENSHQALVGRRIRSSVRLLARTAPYRAVVRDPTGSPARRWQRVDRDRYRIWGGGAGLPVLVASGVTERSRWQLYLRLPRRGGMCVGMSARPLWRSRPAPSGEGCGARRLAARVVLPALFGAARRGLFAFGRTGREVVKVRVRFDGEDWQELHTLPTPIPPGGRERFWVAPAAGECGALTLQGLDRDGDVISEQRVPPRSEPPPGSPDPYEACRAS